MQTTQANPITAMVVSAFTNQYPQELGRLRHEAEPADAVKAFVKSQLENTGCFGNIVFFNKDIAMRQFSEIDWQQILNED